MNATPNIDTEIVTTYNRLCNVFGTRPPIELVAELTRLPFELTAERLLDISLRQQLIITTGDYTNEIENIYIKQVIECCDSQQCEPNNSLIRKVVPQAGPALRRALLNYLSKNYDAITKDHKKVLQVYKSYIPPPYITERKAPPTFEHVAMRTGLSVMAVKSLTESLTAKGML